MNNKKIRRRLSKEERKKQILESALTVFIKKGYNGATTQEIAKEADLSEVTLFRHFSSKQEMFMKGIEPIIIHTLQESILASKELSPEDQFKYVLTERIKLISKNHKVIRLVLMESNISSELSNLNYIDKIKNILKSMIENMGFEMKDEEITLRILMGSILSFLFMPDINEGNIEDFVNRILPYLLDSFEK